MRQWAYEIVSGTLEQKRYSDRLFHKIVKEKSNFSAQEKRFLKRLSYGTIERCVELDAILAHFSKVPVRKMTPSVRTVLRMALYEIRFMDQIPGAASCNEAVELLKVKEGLKHTGFVNGVLRTVLREGDSVELKSWERVSLPKPLYDHFVSQYGKKTALKIGEAFLQNNQDITLHIDSTKISREDFEKTLCSKKIEVKNAQYMPDALI